MVVDAGVQLRAGDLPAAAAAGAQRARFVGVARSGVPRRTTGFCCSAAFFVLFATMFPTLSEAVTRRAADRRRAVLQQVDAARRFVLLFLTGVGPLLAWRKSTLGISDQFLWPALAASRPPRACLRSAFASGRPGSCFALCAFVADDRPGVRRAVPSSGSKRRAPIFSRRWSDSFRVRDAATAATSFTSASC